MNKRNGSGGTAAPSATLPVWELLMPEPQTAMAANSLLDLFVYGHHLWSSAMSQSERISEAPPTPILATVPQAFPASEPASGMYSLVYKSLPIHSFYASSCPLARILQGVGTHQLG